MTQTPLELAAKHNCIVVEAPCDCGILGPSYILITDVDDGRKKAIQFSCCGVVVEYKTTQQTPLERAARVVCMVNMGNDGNWESWLTDARAVLMAIREPSKAMYSAGALQSGSAVAAWQAMIDAALGET